MAPQVAPSSSSHMEDNSSHILDRFSSPTPKGRPPSLKKLGGSSSVKGNSANNLVASASIAGISNEGFGLMGSTLRIPPPVHPPISRRARIPVVRALEGPSLTDDSTNTRK